MSTSVENSPSCEGRPAANEWWHRGCPLFSEEDDAKALATRPATLLSYVAVCPLNRRHLEFLAHDVIALKYVTE